jgi:hypothetical protein
VRELTPRHGRALERMRRELASLDGWIRRCVGL